MTVARGDRGRDGCTAGPARRLWQARSLTAPSSVEPNASVREPDPGRGRDPAPGDRPARAGEPAAGRLLVLAGVVAVVAAMLAAAHDARRWMQALALALPPLLWLLWPLRDRAARVARAIAAWAWAMAFVVDAAVRGYLAAAYGAAPDGSMVVSSVANTVGPEAREYLALAWPALLPWVAAVLGCGLALARVLRREAGPRARAGRPSRALRRWRLGLVLAALPPATAAYAIKPWRRLHPAVFWPRWAAAVDAQRAAWADLGHWRAAALASAREQGATTRAAPPATVVLVLADSVNRDNLGLYGYRRDTTPRLTALRERERGRMAVLRDAWSAHAGTIPAVRGLFQFGATEPHDPSHLLALARVAGWRTWWLSTHDDLAIEQAHARFADVVEMTSRTPGRASRTPDEALLGPLREALADPAPLKFVVVHAMGAHPHYRLRYPSGANPFEDADDEVARELRRRGRPFWIRAARDHYDAALRHHDGFVARTFELLRERLPRDGYGAWMYLSDHGQEVGHEIDHAGHSAATRAGYRIPAVIWQSRPRRPLPVDLETRPFRGDWAAWTLAHLLGLRWRGDDPRRDVLRDEYRWASPELPPARTAAASRPRPGATSARTPSPPAGA